MNSIIIRQAKLEDIPFVAKVIVEAEKSGTEHAVMARYFGITDAELQSYIEQILEEEVEGCELSLSGFFVADCDGRPVSAQGGWMEGAHDGMRSEVLKSNLLMYVFPKDKILATREKSDLARDLHIERELGAYQLEYSYTDPEFRGQHLVQKCMLEHMKKAKYDYKASKIQVHILEKNMPNVRAKERLGFHVAKRFVSNDPRVLEFYPSNVLLLMEADLTNMKFEVEGYSPSCYVTRLGGVNNTSCLAYSNAA